MLPATYCTDEECGEECEEDEHKEDLLYSVLFLKNFIKAVIILLNSTPAFTILWGIFHNTQSLHISYKLFFPVHILFTSNQNVLNSFHFLTCVASDNMKCCIKISMTHS